MIAFILPGGYEWLIILAIVLLLFGHRLPGMARSLGSGITEFKRGLKEGSEQDSKQLGSKPASGEESKKDGSAS